MIIGDSQKLILRITRRETIALSSRCCAAAVAIPSISKPHILYDKNNKSQFSSMVSIKGTSDKYEELLGWEKISIK